MIQSAETRRTLHTHTHTHTHTGKLLPSIKQIGTICFAFYFIIFPNFTFADNITASSTCTNGVLGTYTGPADIEANFAPNTINTTWYSNGTAMSGNGVPSSCTYAAPLTPPTPAPRAGYVFDGWRLKLPACNLSNVSFMHNGDYDTYPTWGAYVSNDNTRMYMSSRRWTEGTTGPTGLAEPGTWAAYNGNTTVFGTSYCSAKNVDGYSYNEYRYYDGGNPSDWFATYGELTNASGPKQYCWCKATRYTIDGESSCPVTTSNWVFYGQIRQFGMTSEEACTHSCGYYCVESIGPDTDGDGDVDEDDEFYNMPILFGVYDTANIP